MVTRFQGFHRLYRFSKFGFIDRALTWACMHVVVYVLESLINLLLKACVFGFGFSCLYLGVMTNFDVKSCELSYLII